MGQTAELFDLTGKVVIVTGSTKGIGRAMAHGLASAGASVVVSSRKQDLCDQVATEIAEATGADVFALACHVGEWDAIPGFVEAVHERFGRIDVLVNNAGINPARITPQDMTLEYWRKVFSVNLEGPLRTSQCVVPIMREQGGGSIVNIGTMAAYSGGGAVCAYGASKAALLNLTKSMAHGVGAVEDPGQHALPRAVHERDDGGRRAHRARVLRARGRRNVHEAHRRSRRDRRARLLPGERRVVVRHRRRPVGVGRDDEVTGEDPMIATADVLDLVARWWFNYDEGNFAVLPGLLSDDVHFSCRTDTGTTDYEEFVRADVRGRDAVMAWQTDHRVNSPYPLRHNGTNVHVVEQRNDEATFSSYILVTQIVGGAVSPLSTAIVTGAVRRAGDALVISELEVVLDTQDSVLFSVR